MAAIWIISVVVFFALWAILANVIRRISVKKGQNDAESCVTEHDEANKEENNQQNIQQ